MPHRTLIIGQGLAGSVLAWQAAWRGDQLIVVDAGNSNTASAVAAGLVMPLSGQRLVSRPDYPALLAAAEACYRRIEQETGQTLFRSRIIERRFVSAMERQHWEDRLASQPVPPESRFALRNVHPAFWQLQSANRDILATTPRTVATVHLAPVSDRSHHLAACRLRAKKATTASIPRCGSDFKACNFSGNQAEAAADFPRSTGLAGARQGRGTMRNFSGGQRQNPCCW
jgi:hypothetical protein